MEELTWFRKYKMTCNHVYIWRRFVLDTAPKLQSLQILLTSITSVSPELIQKQRCFYLQWWKKNKIVMVNITLLWDPHTVSLDYCINTTYLKIFILQNQAFIFWLSAFCDIIHWLYSFKKYKQAFMCKRFWYIIRCNVINIQPINLRIYQWSTNILPL